MDVAAFVIPVVYTITTMGSSQSSSTTSTAHDDGATLPKTCFEAVEGVNLTGQTFLVTGAYSGLGAATTKALLKANGTVIVAGRNKKLQDEFVQELGQEYDASRVDGSRVLDLADLASVRDFALYVKKTYPKIDCLVLNAGVMNTPAGKTVQGLEVQMGVNAVGHFLLAKLLVPQTARQVWVSSRGHALVGMPPNFDYVAAPSIDLDAIDKVGDDASYDGWWRYQQSKLANILLAKQFAAAYPNMVSVAVHPGLVNTNLFRHGNP